MTKKKVKSEKIDHKDTEARGVFFSNYDLYDVEPTDLGPGAGIYGDMSKYKSVEEFRKAKEKRKKIKKRKAFFQCIELSASNKQQSGPDINNLADPYAEVATEILTETQPVAPIGIFDNTTGNIIKNQ